MSKNVTITVDGKDARLRFDSFEALLAHNERRDKHSAEMASDSGFCGAGSVPDAIAKARKGLPREGIKALAIAEQNVEERQRDVIKPNFAAYNDVTGGDVDVALYLTGEPECMVNYVLEDEPQRERVVTLVTSVAFHCGISKTAIKQHGQGVMSLMEAIETTGLVTEVWLECIIAEGLSNMFGDNPSPRGKTGRISVRIKAPGELFDAGLFMYALTHDSLLRGHFFNAYYELPAEWRSALAIQRHGHFGYPTSTEYRMEDYPEGAIFLPAVRGNGQSGQIIDRALRKLDLLRD